jgi:hypothetical protein
MFLTLSNTVVLGYKSISMIVYQMLEKKKKFS